MSISKFDELVNILTKDYEETDKYLERNCTFINQLTQELSNYLECGMENLFLYILTRGKEKKCSLVKNTIKGLIAEGLIGVTDEGCFVLPLLIQIKAQPFSSSHWSTSFKEKNLTPPSQVVLIMTIKQRQENLFTVVTQDINQKEEFIEESFNIDFTIDNPWNDLMEACFKTIKETIEGGVEKRIRELLIKKDNTLMRAFGVSIPTLIDD